MTSPDIECFDARLLHGITQSCRAAGPAPDLCGYERSSAPVERSAYRTKLVVADIAALIEAEGAPVALPVAHDWGGAVAWGLARRDPSRCAGC